MVMSILVIDDEEDIRNLISDILIDARFEVRTAANSSKAIELINERTPSAIILDIWLQNSELDGLAILEIVKKKHPLIPIIVISGHGTIATAVTAIRMGAFDYIEKPFSQEKLLIVLKRACETAKLKKENIELKSQVLDKDQMIGESIMISKIKLEIEKIAPTSSRLIISGPVGSGKELTARLIHKNSKFANGPFVTYDPTGIICSKVQNDLFGETISKTKNPEYESEQKSLLEKANNGTLYIDEIGNLPLAMQEKLLKIIQTSLFENGNKKIKLNIRIIASTTRDLDEDIKNGKFSKELYHRLNVCNINIPTLLDHRDDIELLVEYFAKYLSKSSGIRYRLFSEDAILALKSYSWPGNIRQLQNVIEWTLIMNPISENDCNIIRAEMLPPEIIGNNLIVSKTDQLSDMMSMPLREARELFERQYLVAQMNRFNNNISRTSAFVGMERSALHRKLKLLKINSNNCNMHDDREIDLIVEEGLA
jgi:two-component system nitrogen regulation response regulator NtrX